jgi:hypothetical protein
MERMGKLFCVLLIGATKTVAGFATVKTFLDNGYALRKRGELLSRLLDSDLPPKVPADNIEVHPKHELELWLDLRGLRLSPRVFVDHFLRDLATIYKEGETDGPTIDRVLLSDMDEKDLKLELQLHVPGLPALDELVHGILEVDTDNEREYRDVIQIKKTNEDSDLSQRVVGQLIEMNMLSDSNVGGVQLVDPIPAIECMGRGDWLIIDPGTHGTDDDRLEAAIGLFDLTQATSSMSAIPILGQSLSSDGLLSDKAGHSTGGIAFVCRSTSDLYRFLPHLRRLRLESGTKTQSTDSGILLQVEEPGTKAPGVGTALVLSLDFKVWESAFAFLE